MLPATTQTAAPTAPNFRVLKGDRTDYVSPAYKIELNGDAKTRRRSPPQASQPIDEKNDYTNLPYLRHCRRALFQIPQR